MVDCNYTRFPMVAVGFLKEHTVQGSNRITSIYVELFFEWIFLTFQLCSRVLKPVIASYENFFFKLVSHALLNSSLANIKGGYGIESIERLKKKKKVVVNLEWVLLVKIQHFR